MDLQIQAEEADTSTYVLNGEWALLGMCLGENIHNLCQYTPTTTQNNILQRDSFWVMLQVSVFIKNLICYTPMDMIMISHFYTYIYLNIFLCKKSALHVKKNVQKLYGNSAWKKYCSWSLRKRTISCCVYHTIRVKQKGRTFYSHYTGLYQFQKKRAVYKDMPHY